MRSLHLLAACCVSALTLAAAAPRLRLDLNGAWQFRLDPENAGVAGQWFANAEASFPDRIQVPGAWQAQGFGKPTDRLRHDYEGTAWYRRTIEIPAAWTDRTVLLRVGRAHRITTAYVNGVEVGKYDGISAPFAFDVSKAIRPGTSNVVVFRIENPAVEIGEGPVTQKPAQPTGMFNYLGNWGGFAGDVVLEALPRTRIESVVVLPDIERRQAVFRVAVAAEARRRVFVRVSVPSGESVQTDVNGDEVSLTLPLPKTPLWTPETPNLVTAAIQLLHDGREVDRYEQRFGLRQATTRGNALLLNGKPYYLRGYGDDNIEVLTGFPAWNRGVLLDRLKLAKSFGFNTVRFHSFVPPAEYFDVADEVGILVMAELPAAYTQYFLPFRDYLRRELGDVLTAYRNHPSLLSVAMGNELDLTWLKTDEERKQLLSSLADFYAYAKQLAPATLVLSTDGHDLRPTDMVSVGGWARPAADRPTLRHEFGEYYCSLPDVALIGKFTGVLKPTWLEPKRDWIASHRLESQYPVYLQNSRILQQSGRKFQIERVRANPDVTGYHYWLMVDFPGGAGEGDSWEEGWVDYFWQPKVKAEQGRKLNSPVLLLIDRGVDDRTLWAGERKPVRVSVSNYGDAAIRNGRLSWAVMDGERRVAGSERGGIGAALGAVSDIGEVFVDASGVHDARKLELVVSLDTAGQTYRNRWSFWTFPQGASERPELPVVSTIRSATLRQKYPWLSAEGAALDPRALLVTGSLDRRALAHLKAGGRVWLMLGDGSDRRGADYFPAAGGAFGTVVSNSRALERFPHDGLCDLQFYNLIHGAYALPIDNWPAEIEPMVGGIRTKAGFLSKTKDLTRVAYAVEARVGAGKLLVTTFRLRDHLDDAFPEAVTMFDSLLRYCASGAFDPKSELPESALVRLASD